MQVAGFMNVYCRQQLVYKIALSLRLRAPSLVSWATIASATENERNIKALGIASRSLDDTACDVFPEDADEVAGREEFLIHLCLVFLDGPILQGLPYVLWHRRLVRLPYEGHDLWKGFVFESAGLHELYDVVYTPACIACRLRLDADILSLPRLRNEVICEGDLPRRFQLEEVAKEQSDIHSAEELAQVIVFIGVYGEPFVPPPHGAIHFHVQSFCWDHAHFFVDKEDFVIPRADQSFLLSTRGHALVGKRLHAHRA